MNLCRAVLSLLIWSRDSSGKQGVSGWYQGAGYVTPANLHTVSEKAGPPMRFALPRWLTILAAYWRRWNEVL